MYKGLKTRLVHVKFKIILGIPGFPFISVEILSLRAKNYLPVEKIAGLGFYLD